MPDHSSSHSGALARPRSLFSFSTLGTLFRGRVPGQVVMQYSDQCNASCAQCGMRISNKYPRTKMEKDHAKKLIDAMAEKGVQALSFTGGEPLLHLGEIAELSRHAAEAGIRFIRTGTNGYIFKGADQPGFKDKISRYAETLANTPINTFWVSVDSAKPEMHERNRGLPGVIAGIEQALPIFHDMGVFPSANLGINRYTGGDGTEALRAGTGEDFDNQEFYELARRAFRKFYSFVHGLGFTIVNACYPMSLDSEEAEAQAIYAATSEDDFISFTPEEKIYLFKALFNTIPEFRAKMRIFSPRSSLLALIRQYEGNPEAGYACRGGIDFFFIDSKDNNTYPCGYRGSENLGSFADIDLGKIDAKAHCRECDWECFRDPSELIGPIQDILRRPYRIATRFITDWAMTRIWYEDLKYYRACEFFNGRTPPNLRKLDRFSRGFINGSGWRAACRAMGGDFSKELCSS
ncbi:MAG: radical SAM protein [Desulfovibrio sp.]|nr:MAG: radical SAM protein [Desulfovibrio sp.]